MEHQVVAHHSVRLVRAMVLDVERITKMNLGRCCLINYGMGSAVFESEDPFPDVRAFIPARGLTSPECFVLTLSKSLAAVSRYLLTVSRRPHPLWCRAREFVTLVTP